ncbi:putative MO25-like protein [Glycine soja]|uniref:Putative MO25-like protein n=1 Tax=Glycine soja TaxID=3848 RepID=A0A445GA41_GLYSO|nr:putative MO25-like protein [Glycine soja]
MEPHSIRRIIVFVTITIFSLSLLAILTGFGSGGTLTVAMAVSVTRGSEKGTMASKKICHLDCCKFTEVILVMALYQICSGLTTKKFFDYIQLPNFDIAADAAATFKELMTRHKSTVADFLSNYYEWEWGDPRKKEFHFYMKSYSPVECAHTECIVTEDSEVAETFLN